jgi:hypothetical protein
MASFIFFSFFSIKDITIMLYLLKNNFVISALVSLAILIFIFMQNRSKEEGNNNGVIFYFRLFALTFILVLSVLYFKTGELTVPSIQTGGALPLSPMSNGTLNMTPNIPPSAKMNSPGLDLNLQCVNLGQTPF